MFTCKLRLSEYRMPGRFRKLISKFSKMIILKNEGIQVFLEKYLICSTIGKGSRIAVEYVSNVHFSEKCLVHIDSEVFAKKQNPIKSVKV